MKTLDDLKRILLGRDTTLPRTITEQLVFRAIQGNNPSISIEISEMKEIKSLIFNYNSANQEYHKMVDTFEKRLNSPKLSEKDMLPLMEQWGEIDNQLDAAKLAYEEITTYIQEFKKKIADFPRLIIKLSTHPQIKQKSYVWLNKLIAYFKDSFLYTLFEDPNFYIHREQLLGMPEKEASSERQLVAFIKHVIGRQDKFPAEVVKEILNIVHRYGGILCFDLAFNTSSEKRFGLIEPEAKLLLEDLDIFIEKHLSSHCEQQKLLKDCIKINRSLAEALIVAIQNKNFNPIKEQFEKWKSMISNIFQAKIPIVQIHLKFASASLMKIKEISEFLIQEQVEGRNLILEDSLIKTLTQFQNFTVKEKGPISDILKDDYLKIMAQKKLQESISEIPSLKDHEMAGEFTNEITKLLSNIQTFEESNILSKGIMIQYKSHKENGSNGHDSKKSVPSLIEPSTKEAVNKIISI